MFLNQMYQLYENNTIYKKMVLFDFTIYSENYIYDKFNKLFDELSKDISLIKNKDGIKFFLEFKKVVLFNEFVNVFLNYYGSEKKINFTEVLNLTEKINSELKSDFFKNKVSNIKTSNHYYQQEIKLWLTSSYFNTEASPLNVYQNDIYALELKFNQNIDRFKKYVNNNTFYTTSENLLTGLRSDLKNKAKATALKKKKNGFLFFLDADTTYTLLSQINNRSLREKIYLKFNDLVNSSTAIKENLSILKKAYLIKNRMAKENGFDNYKDMVLSNYTLKSDKINEYFDDLSNKNEKHLIEFYDDILQLFEDDGYNKNDFSPFDLLFYIDKWKKNFQNAEFKKFFPIKKTIHKALKNIGNIFQITFTKTVDDFNRVIYEVSDNISEREGVIIIDFGFFKKSGAYEIDFNNINYVSKGNLPQISLINLGLETNTKYFDFYNLKNFLHEVGHFLHSFFGYNINNFLVNSNLGYKISWDLIETPSKLLENIIFNKEFLKQIYTKYDNTFDSQYNNTLTKFFKLSSFFLQENIVKNKLILNLYENVKTNKKISSINKELKENNIFYLPSLDVSHFNYNFKTDYLTDSSYVYLFSEQLVCQLINKFNINEFRHIYENIFNNDLHEANKLIKNETNIKKIDLKNFVHAKNLKF